MKIEVIVGNIVKQPDMEAVVNSANANLRLGSGVAGAIHTAAGPALEAHCKPHAPLAYGSFLVTPGYQLPNLWVAGDHPELQQTHQLRHADRLHGFLTWQHHLRPCIVVCRNK